jgi:hypothetical protein
MIVYIKMDVHSLKTSHKDTRRHIVQEITPILHESFSAMYQDVYESPEVANKEEEFVTQMDDIGDWTSPEGLDLLEEELDNVVQKFPGFKKCLRVVVSTYILIVAKLKYRGNGEIDVDIPGPNPLKFLHGLLVQCSELYIVNPDLLNPHGSRQELIKRKKDSYAAVKAVVNECIQSVLPTGDVIDAYLTELVEDRKQDPEPEPPQEEVAVDEEESTVITSADLGLEPRDNVKSVRIQKDKWQGDSGLGDEDLFKGVDQDI